MFDCDLHTHSTASDGLLSPENLVAAAKRANVRVVALTDHDTVGGISEAQTAAVREGVTFVPGIEMTTRFVSPEGGELHMVGLFVEPAMLEGYEKRMIESREFAAKGMVELLREKHGFEITYEDVCAKAKGMVGRPHIADALIEKKYVPDLRAAFERHLGSGCDCYVSRDDFLLTPEECICAIHTARGLAVLAHPCLCKLPSNELEQLCRSLRHKGLDGIEVCSSCMSKSDRKLAEQIARKLGLLQSGGSDFHGRGNIKIGRGREGNVDISFSTFERLASAASFKY